MTIRVCYLIDSLGVGGAERGLVLTLRQLDRSRFEPEVWQLGGPQTLAPDVVAAGARHRSLGVARGPKALAAVPVLARRLRAGRFDIVHTALVWSSIAGRPAARRAGAAVVSHIANADPQGLDAPAVSPSVRRKQAVVNALDAWTGRRHVDRFVAITEAVRDRPIRGASWDRSRIDVVLRGVDLAEFDAAVAREPEPPIGAAEGPTVVAVGRLEPQKGHRHLVRAMPDVLREFPGARLLIAGDGNLRAELEATVADLGLGSSVDLLGVRRDVPALLARADAFVLPSLWEGQSNALLEAMAAGVPIVATEIPAVAGTLRHDESGLLVAPGDHRTLGAAIRAVLRDPVGSKSMGAAARAIVEARHDIRSTTRRLEAVYERVLAERAA